METPTSEIRWQFSLRQLFVSVTMIALAFGAIGSALPPEVTIPVAIAVSTFWTGTAIITFGTGVLAARSYIVQIVGALVISVGFAVTMVGVLIGFIVGFALFISLLAHWMS